MQKLIAPFDPWKSQSCTCPDKYSLNVYTGCAHGCLYCYSSSYIPDFFNPRPKKHLAERITKDIETLDKNTPISISNSTDPYQPLEKTFKCTRRCLELLLDFRKLIVTKSDLITRDIDLLSNTVVAMTITTISQSLAKITEPFTPPPQKRIDALKTLNESGIPTIARIDPIIPQLNEDTSELIEKLAAAGVRHIVSSTYKAKQDNFKRLCAAFPKNRDIWHELYTKKGEHLGGATYMPKEARTQIMKKTKEQAEERGMTFATCRENIDLKQSTKTYCDGAHLLTDQKHMQKEKI
ncbi:MAG: radical SAM protein [archaeon]